MSGWDDLFDNIRRNYQRIFREDDATDAKSLVLVDEFHERAEGFRRAGDVIVDEIVENFNVHTQQMLPAVLTLYRQAAELYLKSMRLHLKRGISSRFAFNKEHDLLELWLPIESYLRSVGFGFEDGILHFRVAELVKELSGADTYGDRFRYPDSRHPKASEGIWTNLEVLRLSIAELGLLTFGFPEIISLLRDQGVSNDTETRHRGE